MLRKLESKDSKFVESWNPEKSTRERRKLTRHVYNDKRKAPAIYDEEGIHIKSRIDVCDCFDKECCGCHFECPKCNSPKCGTECRIGRKWIYESQEIDGNDAIKKNPLKKYQ